MYLSIASSSFCRVWFGYVFDLQRKRNLQFWLFSVQLKSCLVAIFGLHVWVIGYLLLDGQWSVQTSKTEQSTFCCGFVSIDGRRSSSPTWNTSSCRPNWLRAHSAMISSIGCVGLLGGVYIYVSMNIWGYIRQRGAEMHTKFNLGMRAAYVSLHQKVVWIINPTIIAVLWTVIYNSIIFNH